MLNRERFFEIYFNRMINIPKLKTKQLEIQQGYH